MFNRGFYPSTPEVVELMIAPYVYGSGRDYYSGNAERSKNITNASSKTHRITT